MVLERVGDRSLGGRVVKPTKKFGGGSLMMWGLHVGKRGWSILLTCGFLRESHGAVTNNSG